jgi:uncharacterized protein DUF11
MQKLTLFVACLFFGLLAMAQRTEKDPTASKSAVADLSIASVTLAYTGPTLPAPTVNTAHGTEQGNPNTAASHPITQCTVVVHEDFNEDDDVILNVTLPLGVKVQQKPPNATTGPGPDYHASFDGIIHMPIGHMTAGQSITLQFTYTTPATGTSTRNEVSATVKGSKPDSNATNNSRSANLK